MLKTGDILVDQIMEAVAKLPVPAREKILALARLAQIAAAYANAEEELIESVFCLDSQDVL